MEKDFIYHSFPRKESDYKEGLTILRSMVKHGMFLFPEKISYREHLSDGSLGTNWTLHQIRLCFSCIPRSVILEHEKDFGSFSLEFSIENFTKIGGIPVFYLPAPDNLSIGLNGLSAMMIARVGEIQKILHKLAIFQEWISNGTLITFRAEGSLHDVDEEEKKVIQYLLNNLRKGTQPFEDLRNTVEGLANYFYPTDDLKRGEEMKYYRQREWRVMGSTMKNDEFVASKLSKSAKLDAIEIFPHLVEKNIEWREKEVRILDLCRNLKNIDGKHILTYATRIYVPNDVVSEAKTILTPIFAKCLCLIIEPWSRDPFVSEFFVPQPRYWIGLLEDNTRFEKGCCCLLLHLDDYLIANNFTFTSAVNEIRENRFWGTIFESLEVLCK